MDAAATKFEELLIDAMDRFQTRLGKGLNKTFDFYSDLNPGATVTQWIDGALVEMIELTYLRSSFSAFAEGSMSPVDFVSMAACKKYLKSDFHQYAQLFSESLRLGIASIGMTERQYVFRFQDGRWNIIFEGRKISLDRNYCGLSYIHVLLAHPGQEIAAQALKGLALNRSAHAPSEISKGETNEFLTKDAGLREERILGQWGINELLKARKILEVKIESCKNAEERLLMQDQLRQLDREINAEIPSDADRRRTEVKKAITRVINAIRKGDSAFAEFLSKTLHTGLFLLYQPPTDSPVWRT